jgi:sarcosine dehydrogenase
VFGEKLGWERPNWFAIRSLGEADHDVYTYGGRTGSPPSGASTRACREAAVLIDQTSFAKFALKGPDAPAALDWICANDVRKPVGSLTYTQMLNDQGGIEADLTVARVADDEFYIVTGTGFATHDFDWIRRNIPPGANAQLFDVTSAYSVLTLMGPASRDILSTVTAADLSNEAFPFGTFQTIGIAGCPVRALRITYMGELGWELHLPTEYAPGVRHADVGRRRARPDQRRVPRHREHTAGEGLPRVGQRHRPRPHPHRSGPRLGGEDEERHRLPRPRGHRGSAPDGVRKLLAAFTVDPSVVGRDVILLGRETIYRDGERVGWLTSGGYGYTIGRSIGYGYVRNPAGLDAQWVLAGATSWRSPASACPPPSPCNRSTTRRTHE